ncbi:MAG TPA: GNAT family N-acetyltransferase [Spongiibacteraceae bacterium]|nr:GNAT family N-acetyltransferase [Spongiibacteraceae bacterium]HCS26346.1 GNAT family N-acetyltransferase [Spongiibacteraceae bacterium]|tara:strand:+ start:2480 stop:3025 length:546 start_codon:yes stop_codon:yes gene_type:complete
MVVRKKYNREDLVIRKAKDDDLPVLVDFLVKLALHVAGPPSQKLKKKERKRLLDFLASALSDKDKLVVVAELPDAGLVGMAYIYIWRSQGIWEQAGDHEFSSGIIDDIWVEPAFRKLGIFSAMLRELIAFAESRAVPELILEYAISNKEADATWKRLGFQVTGVRAAAFTSLVKEKLEAGA